MQRGRPKKNKLITSLKVRTWFNAVALASGKTAYELEREFSPAYLAADDEYAKRRPRLWEKYRLGSIEPSSKPIKGSVKSIAERVEEVYPGTIYWLRSPIWKLVDFDRLISMEEIRDVYYSLDPRINKYLIHRNSPDRKQLFWRNNIKSKTDDIAEIYTLGGFDAIVALLAIIRESINCQDVEVFREANFALITLLEKDSETSFDIALSSIRTRLIRNFTRTWLPSGNDEFHKPFYDVKHRGLYDISRSEGRKHLA